jgi:hypothetical protein
VSTTVFIVCELYTFFSFPVEEEEEELYEYTRRIILCRGDLRFLTLSIFSPLFLFAFKLHRTIQTKLLCLFTLHLTDVRPWTVVSLFDGRKQALARSKQQSQTLWEGPIKLLKKNYSFFFYDSHRERKRRNVQLKFDGGLQLENGVTEIITTRRGVNFCRWECHKKFIIGWKVRDTPSQPGTIMMVSQCRGKFDSPCFFMSFYSSIFNLKISRIENGKTAATCRIISHFTPPGAHIIAL